MTRNTRVVTLLCLVTGVAYLVRTDIAVAQERMAPALGLSMTDMGAITAWGFQLSYALWQVPAGMFGERFGARTALALSLLGCSVASLATGFMPERGAAITLVGTRILLGISQAAVFPVAAMAVAQYIDREHRVRANAFCIAISSLGAAIAPLLMAPVMERYGWRAVFVLSGAIGLAAAVIWMLFMVPKPSATIAAPALTFASLRTGTRKLAADPNLQRLSLRMYCTPRCTSFSSSGSFAISQKGAASPCSRAAYGRASQILRALSARQSSGRLLMGWVVASAIRAHDVAWR